VPRKVRDWFATSSTPASIRFRAAAKARHRKFLHALYPGAGDAQRAAGDDAKHYQEKQVRRAIERLKQ